MTKYIAKMFFVLTCCITLTSAYAAQQDQHKKKGQGQGQQQHMNAGQKGHKGQGQGQRKGQGQYKGKGQGQYKGKGQGQYKGKGQGQYKGKGQGQYRGKGQGQYKGKGQGQYKGKGQGQYKGKGQAQYKGKSKGQYKGQKYQVKHFKFANKANPNVPHVKYAKNYKIQGAYNWHGSKYVVFRNYNPVWHNQVWWTGHYNHTVFVFGGWYYWNAGYWFPAWGYDPGAVYYYNGPIYASSPTMDPGQVVANVQSALQEQGYYQGDIDGILGPQTRAALAGYQQDNGLTVTSAVDEPTLDSLGIS
jgi:hypothetical protein